jgi:ferritin-like metal-binding protein YciE
MNTLTELYVEQLKDLYSAETQILKALPKMTKAASHAELQRAFTRHRRETERQVERLERIFRELGHSPRGKKCEGMEGLIKEGEELIKERPDPDVLDAGLISAAQHVEHYEMAGYGTVRTYAEQLGRGRDAQLLQQTLDEEKATDELLTQLAESSINVEAEEPGEEAGAQGGRGRRGAGRRARGRTRRSGGRSRARR